MDAEHDGSSPNNESPNSQQRESELGLINSRFVLGQLAMTKGVANEVSSETVLSVLQRHARGDWGDLDDEDKKENENAVRTGEGRILSAYWVQSAVANDGEVRVYVITESDRSVTTVLLTDEY